MAYMNTLKSAVFIKAGDELPTPPANFFEVAEEFVVNPNPTIEEYKRISGKLGTLDTYADTCHVTFSQKLTHKMRSSNAAGDNLAKVPEYGEVLKICGFDEIIDTETEGQESVTYKNTQTPTRGSGIFYIDGKKITATDTLVGDVSFNFEVGKVATMDVTLNGFLDNKGVPANEPNPAVTLNEEPLLVVGCTDFIKVDGTKISADKITIEMGSTIDEFYAFGKKEFNLTDYAIKLTADFCVDSDDYASAIRDLNNRAVKSIGIVLGANQNGYRVNGKSVYIGIPMAKAYKFEDTVDKNTLKRSMTWLLQPTTNGTNISIKHGYFG